MITTANRDGSDDFQWEIRTAPVFAVLLSALGDRGKELGLDTLGGFLSGLFLSGAKGGYNAAEFNRMGKEAFETGSYGDYISLGLLADRDTEACRYAEEIRKKLNAGREVKNIEMGQLAAAVYAEALGVGEKRTAEEQEAPENDLGEGSVDGEDAYGQNSITKDKAWKNTVDNASEYDIIDSDTLPLSS